ncbi:MAG: peptide ABC transporter substrate-binding protein, partial [Ktedonobacterales bacterium]
EGGCSGPFKVASYGGGKLLKLVPNTYWEAAWQKLTITEVDRPAFAKIDDEYTAYDKAGQFDFTDVPAGQYSLARSQDDFNEVPTLSTSYFGLNFDKAPFDNVLIRRAFDLALNKQILVDRILNGGASPTNHIIPRGMPGFDTNLVNPPPDSTESLTGNPAAASSLIQQAAQQCKGTATPPDFCPYILNAAQSQEIDIMYDSNSDTDKSITTAAANSWAQVLNLNVKAAPSNLPTSSYYGNITPGGSYQAWSIGWIADYPDPQDWTSLQFTHSPLAYNNASDVNDSNLDHLMAKADTDLNPDRMATYNQIEQDLVNLVPWIPYAQGKAIWRQRSWVHGFGLNSLLSMTDVNWPNVYITQH